MNKDRYVFILSKKLTLELGGQSEVSLLQREMHLKEICLRKDHSVTLLKWAATSNSAWRNMVQGLNHLDH